jgi:hypothetical protein
MSRSADLHLSSNQSFIPPGAPCNVPWPTNLLGIAYDEYIDETDLTYPSDNSPYRLQHERTGGVPKMHYLHTFQKAGVHQSPCTGHFGSGGEGQGTAVRWW